MKIQIIQLGCALLGEGNTLNDAITNAKSCFSDFNADDIDNDYTNGLTAISTIKRCNISGSIIAVDSDTAIELDEIFN